MQIFKSYSIVAVPFPFTDKDYTKKRPALVVSQEEYQKYTHHCVLAMITSAKQSHWKMDITIQDIEVAGLPGLSVIRPKLFTLDERLILRGLGELSNRDKEIVKNTLSQIFVGLRA
ncbi:MAG: type II toxin-antitoxin system PemK/MazF family toxin [Proteobacteria bacterium]|nr:type II toxin-antitoxin system PemK/MazF family toxin [Pseudomonadota bacterium]